MIIMGPNTARRGSGRSPSVNAVRLQRPVRDGHTALVMADWPAHT